VSVGVLTEQPVPTMVVRSRRSRPRSEHLAGWSFASPALILIGLFGLVPVVWSLILSFQDNDLSGTSSWVGAANYRKLASDPLFTESVRRTLVYCALFVPITIIGSLLLAAALNRKIRFISLYRTAVFVPVVTSTVATAFVFNLLLDPDYGLVNGGLNKVGIGSQGFFTDPNQALYGILAMTVWGWIGFGVIIYLAALQSIPQELIEAAQLDGCSAWRSFWRVQVPQLAPATTFLVVWLTINALQLFDEIYVTTKGGPVHATTVVVYYLYQQAFQFFHGGYAAAIAYVLFLAILVITLIELRVSRRWVER
jgi:multiple sugar transport system permease protein